MKAYFKETNEQKRSYPPELLQGSTAHSTRHEENVDSERSKGGYPSGPDAFLSYHGNEFVGPSDNRAQINESELEKGGEVGELVSARARLRDESRMVER